MVFEGASHFPGLDRLGPPSFRGSDHSQADQIRSHLGQTVNQPIESKRNNKRENATLFACAHKNSQKSIAILVDLDLNFSLST